FWCALKGRMDTMCGLDGRKNYAVVGCSCVIEDADNGDWMIFMYIFLSGTVGHGHTMCKKEGVANFHAGLISYQTAQYGLVNGLKITAISKGVCHAASWGCLFEIISRCAYNPVLS